MAKKNQFFAQKLDGEPMRDENPEAVEEFENNAAPGRWRKDYVRQRPPKSQKQCAVVFALMIDQTIIQANDLGIDVSRFLQFVVDANVPKGQGLTQGFLHELMYTLVPTTNDDGNRVTLSKMNTKQASDLFEGFRRIVAVMGIDIPDPDPNWNK